MAWLRQALYGLPERVERLRQALRSPGERGFALRMLLLSGDEELRIQLFPDLVCCAASETADIRLCRDVIRMVSRQWCIANIEASVAPIVAESGSYETFMRIAELYEELDEALLERLLAQVRTSESLEIREVATFFSH